MLILELGNGFAFVGSQYHLSLPARNTISICSSITCALRCSSSSTQDEDFKPEFAGKMNFYLSAVDDQSRDEDDQPTIGKINLCKAATR